MLSWCVTQRQQPQFLQLLNARYDQLIAQGLKSVGEERRALYLEAQEILAQELPVCSSWIRRSWRPCQDFRVGRVTRPTWWM